MEFFYSPGGNLIFYKFLPGKDVKALVEEKPPTSATKNFIYSVKLGTSKQINLQDPNSQLRVSLLGDEKHLFFFDPSRPTYQGFYNLATGAVVPTKIDPMRIFYLGDLEGSSWLMVEQSESEALIVTPQGTTHKVNLGTNLGFQRPYKEDATFIYAGGYSRPMGQFYRLTIRKSDFQFTATSITREEFFKLGSFEPTPKLFVSSLDPVGTVEYQFVPLPGAPPNRGGKKEISDEMKSIIPKSVDLTIGNTKIEMSPKETSVAYLSGGALLIREIVPIDPNLALKAEEAKLKAQAIREAKMIGLAIAMFAADSDDLLPSGEDFNQKLTPYLKDAKALQGFTFNSKKKNFSEMKDPGNEEIGFKSGPGGRAVVYGDGSVRWKPN